jgi:ankyrin repeat protein
MDHWLLLSEMVRRDDLRLVRELSDADAQGSYGPGSLTLLMIASDSGANHVLDYLITNRALDLNARSVGNKTALMFAAANGNLYGVTQLVSAGCTVNAQDNAGMSALMYVAWAQPPNAVEIAAFLLAAGADKSLKDRQGRTAGTIAQTKRRVLPDGSISVYYQASKRDPLVRLLAVAGGR